MKRKYRKPVKKIKKPVGNTIQKFIDKNPRIKHYAITDDLKQIFLGWLCPVCSTDLVGNEFLAHCNNCGYNHYVGLCQGELF